jgi:hypothetical protein
MKRNARANSKTVQMASQMTADSIDSVGAPTAIPCDLAVMVVGNPGFAGRAAGDA